MIADPGQLANLVIRSESGRYRLHPNPHRGGFAYVYRATDEGPIRRDVAVKVLRKPYAENPVWRRRFIEEANALSRAESEYVVVVHALIEQEPQTGLDFLVMQWAEGEDLSNWVRHGVTFKQTLQIAINICKGIRAIHVKAGLAHGDITPNNVIITKEGIPKIIDFGLAWDFVHEGVTIEKKYAGTLSYIAPEQLTDPDISNEVADIYSLGALLYWLFSGRHYHPQLLQADIEYHANAGAYSTSRDELARFVDMLHTHQVAPLVIPEFESGLVERLNKLILGMLAKRPEDRPASIEEVTRELEDIQKKYLVDTVIVYLPQQVPPGPSEPVPEPIKLPEWTLLVAEQDGNRLKETHPKMHTLEQNGTSYLVSDFLYTPPGNQRVLGVMRTPEGEVVDAAEFEVDGPQFRLYCPIDKTSEPPTLQVENGIRIQSVRDIPTRLLKIDIELSQQEPIELAFVIDRSISDENMKKAVTFIGGLLDKLGKSSYAHRVGGSFYGEFKQHPYRYDWGVNFEANLHHFSSPEAFLKFVDYTLSQPVSLQNKGYCGSVELSLHNATKLTWSSQARYVMIIGSSPPHPTPAQRATFQLLDYSIDEFPGQPDWYQLAWRLVNQYKVNLLSLWLTPPYPVTEPVMKYVRHVNELINPGQVFYTIDDEYQAQQLTNEIFDRVRWAMTYHLSQELYFPLKRPLQKVT